MADADREVSRRSPADGELDVVEIKVRDHGPYKVTGRVRLIDAEGGEFEVDAGDGAAAIALCRCGRSQTKPFCDGSHKEGFESCVRAERAGL